MKRLAYQAQHSRLSLASGLDDYYAGNPGLLSTRGLDEVARAFFRAHDVAHVVFGCGTSLTDEAIVKMWSFFGTTGGFGLLRGYRLAESQEIYERIPIGDVVSTSLRSVSLAPRVILRAHRMRRRWPWDAFESELQRPLGEIRDEYGIVVLTTHED